MGKKARPPAPAGSSSEDDMFEDEDLPTSSGLMDSEDLDEKVDGHGTGRSGPHGIKQRGRGSIRPEREPIYDTEAMHEKLEDFGWSDIVPWEETLVISGTDPAQVENVDDDLARELAFYNQALSAAQEAIGRFEAAGVPWQRPADYYAEMVKSDEHMAKVKEQLVFEQRAIEQAEQRRKAREAKHYAKQVQAEKQRERNATKKKQIDDVAKLRKHREKSGFAGELDYDAELDAMDQGKPQRQQQGFRDRSAGRGGKNSPSKKRMQRDAKFGFGGKKKLHKQNDAVSAADMDGYRPAQRGQGRGSRGRGRGGKGAPGGPGGRGAGGVKKQPMKRPGKAARMRGRGGRGRGRA